MTIATIISVITWFINKLVNRLDDHEKRLMLLEVKFSAIDAKLDAIQTQLQRIANYLASNSKLK